MKITGWGIKLLQMFVTVIVNVCILLILTLIYESGIFEWLEYDCFIFISGAICGSMTSSIAYLGKGGVNIQ
ncbi:hypothetical protein MTHERMMSTA1_07710 [Methanosarcina thermophila MST-A1]|jgi:predicted Na+-dependent transporter|uniref:Uncharacterized protein n=1 Tax=Methanosarcina thermophila TaxID=2210 RepID=A0A3G9CSX8_METTE|nr:hypothetical protein [Methanosarcina thermophila]ALK05436.1 MAG: hypothetical protein AAY43_06625 [Methanosarcina sp. 795]NLU56166.1 hypothetical protein [Methanosarcina thermophila]BAW29308.1 putative conserved hypothetical protein [Methanosarcina thermophila]GLI13645.1 hypothetical protein MTHERMMSTA1_07710 [Methanosarcina thermophila MST-A1]HOA68039.1 hypothetical protein [Methanosarcina thermophila]